MSLPLQFDKQDAGHVVKVFLYTVATAAVALVVGLTPFVHVPEQYLAIAGILFSAINTGGVALERWLGDHAKQEVSLITVPAHSTPNDQTGQ